MTIHKKTFYMSMMILAFSFIGIFCIEKAYKLYDICIGLSTGAFVTLVLNLMNYFREKEQLLNTIYEKSARVHFGLVNIEKLTEKYKFKTGWTTAKRLNEDVFRDYWQ